MTHDDDIHLLKFLMIYYCFGVKTWACLSIDVITFHIYVAMYLFDVVVALDI